MITIVKKSIRWYFRFMVSWITFLALAGGGTLSASAMELGHFSPGLMNIREFAQPVPGNYLLLYNLYYKANTLKDKNGKTVNSISVINLDVNVDSWVTVPTRVHVTEKKILGANDAFLISQPFGNSNFKAALEIADSPEFGQKFDKSCYGFGDPRL